MLDGGYTLIATVFDHHALERLRAEVDRLLAGGGDHVMRSRGTSYAVRNVIEHSQVLVELAFDVTLSSHLDRILKRQPVGLVRALVFDKPPARTWTLPWHKDMTVALQANPASQIFPRATVKSGVVHCEAPLELLAEMLTIRIHLDDTDDENGALQVIPGSHLYSRSLGNVTDAVTITARAGDVLLMRPLLTHRSERGRSLRRRRIVHFEYAPDTLLPDGAGWRWYRVDGMKIGPQAD